MRPHLREMELQLEQRGYPTKKERDAFRNGFSDGVHKSEMDLDTDYPNAYSAGYWHGRQFYHEVAP